MYLSPPKTCLLTLALVACSRPASPDTDTPRLDTETNAATTLAEKAKLVRALEVGSGTAVNLLEVTANVESLDMVDIMPEKSEPVVEILVEEGDSVKAGQRFGLIRFGSRVDVYLDHGMEPQVIPGQLTVAGETVLADAVSAEARRTGEIR